MRVTRAFAQGVGRVAAAPAVLAGVYAVTLLVALPFGLAVRAELEAHLGDSVAAETLATGVNYDWWQEFGQQARGLATSFTPAVIGFAAVLSNLSTLLDAERPPATVVGTAAGYLALWVFLVGGVLDRYARGRPTRAAGFFAACGIFFFRFLRLAVAAAVVYGALFFYVHGWLFEWAYERLTRDLTVERTAFLVRLALYLLFGTLLAGAQVLFDYAKIRAVVEDRRSMLGALLAAARFIGRHPRGVAGLYLLNGAAWLVVLALYAAVAPGAGGAGARMWLGFLAGQAYLLARLATKLLFYASQTAYFQGALAHAGYVAAPAVAPPEPPLVEQMGAPPS